MHAHLSRNFKRSRMEMFLEHHLITKVANLTIRHLKKYSIYYINLSIGGAMVHTKLFQERVPTSKSYAILEIAVYTCTLLLYTITLVRKLIHYYQNSTSSLTGGASGESNFQVTIYHRHILVMFMSHSCESHQLVVIRCILLVTFT